MEEVRQLVQEEGREARNLVAFHVAVDTPSRIARKPPRGGVPPTRRLAPRSAARLRSASAGRDKRSELRARYWALLFGDLQRSVGEIYNTVEAHENLNECQEVILVLENYTRDFKALGEWFRLKWEYDNTPPPQRPQSLAWEIRKTDFVRPESRRAHSVKSSPSVSGKNSPSLSGHNTPSGKNSPSLTGKASPGSGKISPRIIGHTSTSPKSNIEFFSNKISSKIATKPEPRGTKETRLSDIKEKDVTEDSKKVVQEEVLKESEDSSKQKVEFGRAKESQNIIPKAVVIKTTKRKPAAEDKKNSQDNERSDQAKATINQLNAMENNFLAKNLNENASRNENLINSDKQYDMTANVVEQMHTQEIITVDPGVKSSICSESPKSEDNFADISDESSKCNEDKSLSETNDLNETKLSTVAVEPDRLAKTKNTDAKKKETISVTKKVNTQDIKRNVNNKKLLKQVQTDNSNKEIIYDISMNKVDSCKENLLESTEKFKYTSVPNGANLVNDDDTVKMTSSETEKNNEFKTNANDIIAHTENNLESTVNDNAVVIESQDKQDEKAANATVQETSNADNKDKKEELKKAEEKKAEIKTPTRPAYSQAAAKPKLVTKTEVKTPIKTTALYRSKTVVEIRPNSATNRQARSNLNRNPKSKCSYPFNLTTGRTSLFDGSANNNRVIVTKRPIGRSQLAAGDVRNIIKPDIKTRPPRPVSLKINEQGDKNDKTNPALEKIKDCDEYSSSDTVVTQINISRIESSESLRTMVPEDFEAGNSIEVLNVDGERNDNDGWLTVKSRRLSRESKKSKSHWTNRFHQPSATTSLPTLNMIESPKSETNPIIDTKLDRAKSEQPQNKPEKPVKASQKVPKVKDTSMIRQKSDVTGLKTRSSRNKALKRDKNKDKKDPELTKNRLHSSLESLTTGLARSQESTEADAFDFDKWKAEFITNFKYLEEDDQTTNDNEILKSADPSEMSEIAEMTSQIEENERKISLALDFQSEVDQKKLCQEEDLLNRQIMELQQVSDVELDTETDDTETDAEILCEGSTLVSCQSTDNIDCLNNIASCLEHHYESALEGMSWAERVDMLGALEALVARDPGRAPQLHAKLSAGIRRRGSLQDVLRRLHAKQARAHTQRAQLHTQRAARIHQLLARVAEVKVAKNQLIEEKRIRMERRLQKAAENRDQHIKDIVRKAHDEEEKLREIAFIKQLEAENRRHEFLEQCRSLTSRLREMRRERLDKLEQKAAREAAVGARRQALEAARKQHVESLLEKRKERDARVEELKEQKKQERDDAAREKAEGLKSRLSALAAAAALEAVALRSRIRRKQHQSQLRLASHLQAIREKATTAARQPTTSESQEQNSRELNEEEEEAARIEQERRERDRQRALRKRARKLKTKILAASTAPCKDASPSPHALFAHASKLHKAATQLTLLLTPLVNGQCVGATAHGRKNSDSADIDKDFRYDFEDKMSKKKKRKKAAIDKLEKKNEQQNTQKGKKTQNDAQNKNDTQKIDKDMEFIDTENNNNKNEAINKHTDESQADIIQTQNKSNAYAKKKKSDPKNKEKFSDQTNGEENNENDTRKGKNDAINDGQNSKNDAQISKNDEKTKKNGQKTKNDAHKLSKSNSICSSISDMSKVSGKNDKPILINFDVSATEKLVGELYRLATAKEKEYIHKLKSRLPELAPAARMHAVTAFGLLFAILADREDMLSLLSNKAVSMCVAASSYLMNHCKSTALQFYHSPALVHVVTLLNYQLGRDLSDNKELELAKQLSDLISISLDAALCESRLRECGGEPMTSLRARAHNVVSYLCLSGCIARAESAGEARERVQTLVTVCADLCQPHVADVGPERTSALQSLRGALGTSLMGSRAEFCMLFAEGAELSRSQNFVRAARTAHLLRQLAELDHHIVQESFGEGGWPLEFRAAVARLLSQHAPNDKEAPASDSINLSNQRLDLTLSEQMVLDLIVLVGYVVVDNPLLHETITENWGVVKTLCTLPANWLVSNKHCHSLLPTLAALADRPATAEVIYSELSIKMLEDYMNSADGRKVKLIQILKTGKEKAAKKLNMEKTHEKACDEIKDVAKKVAKDTAFTNGDTKRNDDKNDSDNESLDDEI